MIEAQPYPDEIKRLASLRALSLLDTPLEERFERITRMVCRMVDVPIALFNLIDEDRQYHKSAQGLDAVTSSLEAGFCTHTIHESEIMLVPDASKDIRFHDNPFVTGEKMNIGFYAGCPIRTPNGMPIGTLCAIDTKPREVTVEQVRALRDLAAMIETELKVKSLARAQADLIEQLNAVGRLAMIDPLTRLWNEGGMLYMLKREWSEAARRNESITLIMGDIDHFRDFNQGLGYTIGDNILRHVGKRLLESLRQQDTIGRVSGEEFLIMLNDFPLDKIRETVDQIRKDIAETPFTIGDKDHHVTMSFGVATYWPKVTDNVEDFSLALIDQANEALQAAKEQGRNCVVVADQPAGTMGANPAAE